MEEANPQHGINLLLIGAESNTLLFRSICENWSQALSQLSCLRAFEKDPFSTQSPPSMSLKFINPASLGPPRGYSNGVVTEPGARLLFIAGQVGWTEQQKISSADFVEQFDRALANVLSVIAQAGAKPEQIARLVIYVTNKKEYQARRREIGERYRARMGKHFPTMVLLEVKSLLDDDAKVEIEAVAIL